MADRFLGRWKSDTMENFDDYMKALEVNLFLRKAGAFSTTNMDISCEEGVWRWKYKIAFKSGDNTFKLGEEWPEVTPDGRKVISTLVYKDETGHLVQYQVGKPRNSTIDRHIDENGVMIEICTVEGFPDLVCKRTYLRQP